MEYGINERNKRFFICFSFYGRSNHQNIEICKKIVVPTAALIFNIIMFHLLYHLPSSYSRCAFHLPPPPRPFMTSLLLLPDIHVVHPNDDPNSSRLGRRWWRWRRGAGARGRRLSHLFRHLRMFGLLHR